MFDATDDTAAWCQGHILPRTDVQSKNNIREQVPPSGWRLLTHLLAQGSPLEVHPGGSILRSLAGVEVNRPVSSAHDTLF